MGRITLAIATVALIVLHQDVWFWDNNSLVLGFLPIGLAYHAGISIAAAALGAWACIACWPETDEESDGDPPE